MVLTVFEDDDRIFRALCAGASGYMLKKAPPAVLLEAIREAVARGRADVAGDRPPGDRTVSGDGAAADGVTSIVLFRAGSYAEAVNYSHRAVSVIEAAGLSLQDSRLGESWWAQGIALASDGKKTEALDAFRRAERLYEACGEMGASQVADVRARMAALEKAR